MQGYIYNADTYCENCGQQILTQLTPDDDSTQYPQPVNFAQDEADYPQHCGHCGMFLENPLTADGLNELIEMVNAGNCNVPEWLTFYGF